MAPDGSASPDEFKLIADSAPVPMWVTKLDRRRSFVNRAYVDFVGVPYEAAIDFDWRTIIHPDDATETMRQSIAGEASLKTFALEARYRRADGQWRWIKSVSQPRWDESGAHTGFIGVAYDMTEVRESEAALRRSEERLRLAVEGGRMGTWEWDYAAGTGSWSERTAEIMGVDITEVTPAFHRTLVHPDDLPDIVAQVGRLRQVGDSFSAEYRVGGDGRQSRWVSAHGSVSQVDEDGNVRLTGIIRDVTERRRAQEDLSRLNDTLEQQVTERTAERDGMWRLSQDLFLVVTRRWLIRAVNPAVGLFGYAPEDVVGRRFADFVHPDDLRQALGMIRGAAHGPVGGFRVRLRAKDGGWRQVTWSAVPGDAEAYVIGRDTTDEARRREELEAAQEALRQAQKVESLGQLTGGVAHDFNNLLTPIIGNLDLLRRRAEGEREHRLLASALDAADKARLLVQRLLAFSRRQPLAVGPVAVDRLIDGMTSLIASTVGPQIRVRAAVAAGLPAALADANQLEMALLNLSVNARDAMPEGGELTLEAEERHVGEDETDLAPGRYLRLTVTDTGEGMDEATIARAVEPFFSTKGVGKGTGLGLSMVHGLAGQLGGRFRLSSGLGRGTTVELLLPVTDRLPERAVPVGHVVRGASEGRVLLVDDEPHVRAATADMLRELGYAVDEAGSGDEALALIEHRRFDLVVTDHLMPGMTGAELAAILRTRAPDLRLLVVSGFAGIGQIPEDLPRLTKPFTIDELGIALAA